MREALDDPKCDKLSSNIRILRERFEPEAVANEDAERARRAKAAARRYGKLRDDGRSQ